MTKSETPVSDRRSTAGILPVSYFLPSPATQQEWAFRGLTEGNRGYENVETDLCSLRPLARTFGVTFCSNFCSHPIDVRKARRIWSGVSQSSTLHCSHPERKSPVRLGPVRNL